MAVGWIKLHRKLLESDMYNELTSIQRDVLITCLLLANHDEREWEWQGRIFKAVPGQFVTSLEKLCKKCAADVKIQSLRTALLKLEKWKFLTSQSTKTGRIITICKWDIYQNEDNVTNNQTNSQSTNNQQTANKQLTTNKNDKELIKNDKEGLGAVLQQPTKTLTELVEPYTQQYGKDLIFAFLEYWREKNINGKKERWQMQKTFDPKMRLATWKRRDDEKKFGKNNQPPTVNNFRYNDGKYLKRERIP